MAELLKASDLIDIYTRQDKTSQIISVLGSELNPETGEQRITNNEQRIFLKGLIGSSYSLISASIFKALPFLQLHIISDKESAAFFFNDIENLLGEQDMPYEKKRILYFPASYKKHYDFENTDNANVLLRSEVINRLNNLKEPVLIVTYPEAICEKVITKQYLTRNTLSLNIGDKVNIDFITDVLVEYGFERVDFVVEPGQFTIRGGIIDVYSYANDYPYRIEFTGDSIESLRTFNAVSQLSVQRLKDITVVPNLDVDSLHATSINKESFFKYLPNNSVLWIEDITDTADLINSEFEKVTELYSKIKNTDLHLKPADLLLQSKEFISSIFDFNIIETGKKSFFKLNDQQTIPNSQFLILNYEIQPQPSFNKKFELLIEDLYTNTANKISNIILSDTSKQAERLYTIIKDISARLHNNKLPDYRIIDLSLHEGFIDAEAKIACYTDHQLFERYHRYRLHDSFSGKEALSVKELYGLKPGDYVTHIDHGIGRFAGLEKIEANGREQEAIRLVYKDGDILYISIHSLHRISKYLGSEGKEPVLNRLGSNAWNTLKNKTKNKVKDIAKDLIKLYAERKATQGFAFSPDTYLQTELEASFIYEDTPDQIKSTADVKRDMEAENPMDRLICGDVGFGKTEVAIRAAFKAVADSRQVALLVPTTILALQHYNTFRDRLHELPCRVEYISRFRSAKAIHHVLKELEEGKVDIIIGTHKLLGKEIKFKELGLMIIDEEQKFGVAAKEKLKKLKINVDTLTLTATPIPRTLQFSLMGARDLSVISTAPHNRFPIHTELHVFNEEIIRDAITYEIARGGQVFLVHNRVQNIDEIAAIVKRLCPDVKVAVGHGQMKGHVLEQVMIDFIEGDFDVLVATTIVENGLDIPNANTIIINEAHHFGLSDLHQLRGRVGRSNKKAFCYLLAPPVSLLTDDARKRLKAIEEFTELGSGFNIAMRDLDIRGAGNILGAEQSGFISDVGFETYQKILDEAIDELKESEFKDLYKEDNNEQRITNNEQRIGNFVRDCVIETDLSILIPDDYVNSITERLNLYKELDNLEDEKNLEEYEKRLIDRFGPLPFETLELINTIRLRWMAKSTGFEKIVLKNDKFIGYFISNQESPYYSSDKFTKVLEFVKNNPKSLQFRQVNTRLSLSFSNVKCVDDALKVLSTI